MISGRKKTMSERVEYQSGMPPLAIVGFGWSFLTPVLYERQFSAILGMLSQNSASPTTFIAWIVSNTELFQFGLWSIGLLSIVVCGLFIIRRSSAHASMQAALVMSLLSSSVLFLLSYVSSLAFSVT